LLAAALGAARAFVRVLRRFRGLVLPFQAVALRIAPYVVTTLASFAAALLTLERTLTTESQPAQDALLPEAPLLRGLWLALAVLGALRLGYVLAFSRRRAAQPDARALLAIARRGAARATARAGRWTRCDARDGRARGAGG
jgi:hypothetical protein